MDLSVFNWAKNNKQHEFTGTQYFVPVGTAPSALSFLEKTFSVLAQAGNSATKTNCDNLLSHIKTHIIESDDQRDLSLDDQVEEEPSVGKCFASDVIDAKLPVLAGQKARQEIRSVQIGNGSDLVTTSFGEVDLPKDMSVIRTPVSNIIIPIVKEKVHDPLRELMRVQFPSDDVDAELVASVYSDALFADFEGKDGAPKKRKLDYFSKCKGVLDVCCDMLEREYPKYRAASNVTDSYYHPMDSGRWNRSDLEMHSRDMALKRIVRQFKTLKSKGEDDSPLRIGIVTSNDEHYMRLVRMFDSCQIYYPVSEVDVDVVFFHPYEKAIAFDPNMDPVQIIRSKLVKHAPVWESVSHWLYPVNDVKFDAPFKSGKNYGLFGIALHRPRFFYYHPSCWKYEVL